MPHINLPELPGMVGLLVQYPHTAGPLNGLADALLRGPSPLTPGERETIAAYVSSRNECTYCSGIHSAVAGHLLHQEGKTTEHAQTDQKMRALLSIAEKVRVDGRSVSPADIDLAREHGADDKTIHDTVLIAAAFSMYNRYVDGLATLAPREPEVYAQHAKNLAEGGYLR
ncbi:carboxymuconolactone decarboxylase [Actinoplanes sp. NPDC048967]|uniref:carboxymuconolactone decarboxylase family protein n=1 Tax=Actinoplanes sp. NPDC048967 TaxID=3155269 RepID=UPI0033FED0EA